jgi:hypothetical protein
MNGPPWPRTESEAKERAAASAPSFMHLRMSQQANQALSTLRAIQNAETYYLQIYHNGYVDPGVLAGTGIERQTCRNAMREASAPRPSYLNLLS